MDKEIKKAYLAWSEKGASYLNSMYVYDTMMDVNEALQECDEILGEVGLGIGYTSRQNEIDRLLEGRGILRIYIDMLNSYVDTKLDQPLRKDFKENATETISRIHLEDFEVDNTLGLTRNNYITGGMGYSGTMIEEEKEKLTFADFIGTSDGKAEGNGLHMAYTNGSVEDFASIFAAQYEAIKATGALGEDNELTKEEFLEQFYKQGEFTHDSSNPFLNFVSSVLDITIIKPIIEACTGEDLITGEDLTDLERGLKVVIAVVDLVSLGGAIAATKLSEVGLKEGLKAFGKTAVIEFAGNTAACGVGALGEAFDWPVPVTIMLSLAAGITVSVSGNKLLFKNADGIEIGTKTLSDDEVKIVEEQIEKNTRTQILSSEEAEEIAFNAIHGSNGADAVVLGKYGDGGPTAYTSVAKDIDAQYFQLDDWDELASKYSDDEIWKINEKFLDIQTSSGREIYLSHNPADYIGDGTFYAREIQYLMDNGYRFVKEGDIWHAIR